jgi:hypothetical protein
MVLTGSDPGSADTQFNLLRDFVFFWVGSILTSRLVITSSSFWKAQLHPNLAWLTLQAPAVTIFSNCIVNSSFSCEYYRNIYILL